MRQGSHVLGQLSRAHWLRVAEGQAGLCLEGGDLPVRGLPVTLTTLKASGTPLDWPTPPVVPARAARSASGKGAGSGQTPGARRSSGLGGRPAAPSAPTGTTASEGPRGWALVPTVPPMLPSADQPRGRRDEAWATPRRSRSPRRQESPPPRRPQASAPARSETGRLSGRDLARRRSPPGGRARDAPSGRPAPATGRDRDERVPARASDRRVPTPRMAWGHTRDAPGGAQGRY